VNRSDFQLLSKERLQDAATLIQAGRFDGAYHLLGLGVECALKACICRNVRRFDFPDLDLAQKSYRHKFSSFIEAAGLKNEFEAQLRTDAEFTANWLIVEGWSIESRYSIPGRSNAETLGKAISDRQHGVMRWIMRNW
jgi:hypothetical protein